MVSVNVLPKVAARQRDANEKKRIKPKAGKVGETHSSFLAAVCGKTIRMSVVSDRDARRSEKYDSMLLLGDQLILSDRA
jgi:uncharacterized protein YdbL (DUF1318 family)